MAKAELKNPKSSTDARKRDNFSMKLHDYGTHHYKILFEYKFNKAVTPKTVKVPGEQVSKDTEIQGQYFIRLKIDDKEAIVDAHDLYFLMFAIADDDTKMMMQNTMTEDIACELNFIKSLKFSKEDIKTVKAGDVIKVPIEIPLTQLEYTALLAEAQKNKAMVKKVKELK